MYFLFILPTYFSMSLKREQTVYLNLYIYFKYYIKCLHFNRIFNEIKNELKKKTVYLYITLVLHKKMEILVKI